MPLPPVSTPQPTAKPVIKYEPKEEEIFTPDDIYDDACSGVRQLAHGNRYQGFKGFKGLLSFLPLGARKLKKTKNIHTIHSYKQVHEY